MLIYILIGICVVGFLAFVVEEIWIVGEQEGWW